MSSTRFFIKIAAAFSLTLCTLSSFAGTVTQGKMNPACPQFSVYGYPQPQDAKVIRRGFHLCKEAYSSYFDPATRTPLWVAEHLVGDVRGDEPRSNDFRPDPDLPSGVSPTRADYLKSGFDQGHMAPAQDFSKMGDVIMSESFLYSNILPQNPNNNRTAWKELEILTRDWAKSRGEVYVISGPIYADGKNMGTIGRSNIAVPTHLFKVIIDPKRGESIAFVLPNTDIAGPAGGKGARDVWHQTLSTFIVSINDIAFWTHFDFNPLIKPESKGPYQSSKSVMWSRYNK